MAGASEAEENGRAERIRLFREELAQAERDGALTLTDEQHRRLRRYHETILRGLLLASAPVPRAPPRAPSPSRLGPWVVTCTLWAAVLLGAVRFWDALPLLAQAPLLVVVPLALVAATHGRADGPGRRWVGPLALSSSAALAGGVVLLSRALGVSSGVPLGLVFAEAVLAAYAYDQPLLAAGAGAAAAVALSGALDPGLFSWTAAFERPERLFPGGAALLVLSMLPHRRRPAFPPAYRLAALASLFFPLALLGNWGNASWLPVPPEEIQALYRALGATAAALTAVVGLWKRWGTTAYAGASLLALFLYSALVSWGWQKVPDAAFFSGAALLALAASLLIARLQAPPRTLSSGRRPERGEVRGPGKNALVSLLTLAALSPAVVFTQAFYNRSAPAGALEVTERELPRAEPLGASPFLRLRWEQPEEADWPAREKLEELGFEEGVLTDDSRREKAVPRRAYVVLEYEGDAWETWLAQSERALDALAGRLDRGEMTREEFETSRQALSRERRTRSRLSAVDLGVNCSALRGLYPDRTRYLILPGEVRLTVGARGEVGGRVAEVTPGELRVPDRDLPALEGRSGGPDPYWSPQEPRYRVDLRTGSLGRPWIESIAPAAPSE